jgi:SAM-dependent methyltransferase
MLGHVALHLVVVCSNPGSEGVLFGCALTTNVSSRAMTPHTRLLEPLSSERVEVRRHDLLAAPLPGGAFDLGHARNLLMHLPAGVDALRRLLAAVRPGGWLALHEPDFNAVGLSPTSPSWQRTWSAFCDAAVAGGWDPGYGARLVSDIEALDLVEVHAEVISQNSPGGAARARLFAGTLERFRDRMLELGATEEDLEVAQRQLRDPRVTFRAPTLTTAWALQPAAVPQATKEDGGRATSVSRPPTETCDFGRKSASEGGAKR